MTLAEQNKKTCDELLDQFDIEYTCPTLWTRRVYADDEKALDAAMQILTCSFDFECERIGMSYEIQLPK